MEKFDSSKHLDYIKDLPFSFFSMPLYLDFAAYIFERNGENLIVWQDRIFPHDFPSIFLPQKKQNWEHASMAMIAAEDIKKIENENIGIKFKSLMETEYFYKTEDFINPKKELKAHIEKFLKLCSYKLFIEYRHDKILKFYNQWKMQRNRVSISLEEEEKIFIFFLNNLDKYPIRQIYVEVDNKLVGFAWGIEHSKINWVGLELKVDYTYKGLSRFLQNERAKMFSDYEFFSLGTGCYDKGITEYKKELLPNFTKEYFYLFTGGKIK